MDAQDTVSLVFKVNSDVFKKNQFSFKLMLKHEKVERLFSGSV